MDVSSGEGIEKEKEKEEAEEIAEEIDLDLDLLSIDWSALGVRGLKNHGCSDEYITSMVKSEILTQRSRGACGLLSNKILFRLKKYINQ